MGTTGPSTDDWGEAFVHLDEYLQPNGNALDTAAICCTERSSERVVGEWTAESRLREGLVMIAKGACTTSFTPELVTSDLLRSLAELRIEAADIDTMLRDNPAIRAGDFSRAYPMSTDPFVADVVRVWFNNDEERGKSRRLT